MIADNFVSSIRGLKYLYDPRIDALVSYLNLYKV